MAGGSLSITDTVTIVIYILSVIFLLLTFKKQHTDFIKSMIFLMFIFITIEVIEIVMPYFNISIDTSILFLKLIFSGIFAVFIALRAKKENII